MLLPAAAAGGEEKSGLGHGMGWNRIRQSTSDWEEVGEGGGGGWESN